MKQGEHTEGLRERVSKEKESYLETTRGLYNGDSCSAVGSDVVFPKFVASSSMRLLARALHRVKNAFSKVNTV